MIFIILIIFCCMILIIYFIVGRNKIEEIQDEQKEELIL